MWCLGAHYFHVSKVTVWWHGLPRKHENNVPWGVTETPHFFQCRYGDPVPRFSLKKLVGSHSTALTSAMFMHPRNRSIDYKVYQGLYEGRYVDHERKINNEEMGTR